MPVGIGSNSERAGLLSANVGSNDADRRRAYAKTNVPLEDIRHRSTTRPVDQRFVIAPREDCQPLRDGARMTIIVRVRFTLVGMSTGGMSIGNTDSPSRKTLRE